MTINKLSGGLQISCDPPIGDSGAVCSFKQSVLQALFGSNGLSLSSCYFGECVRQGIIDSANGSPDPAVSQVGETNSLGGGVIAGLVVIGVIVAAALTLLLWGCREQRKAKARSGESVSGVSIFEDQRRLGVGIRWEGVAYTLLPSGFKYDKPTLRSRFMQRQSAQFPPGKTILEGVDGEVRPGQMMAILGPSGESGNGNSPLGYF